MSFDDEWAQQKSAAAERQSSQTRLNQSSGEGGGGSPPPLLGGASPDLAATPAKKSAAADSIEKNLEGGTVTAADAADEGTRGAISEFGGWDTAAGLKKAHSHWDSQVNRLMARLHHEKASLRATAVSFSHHELDLEADFRPVRSRIDGV
ncbi:hypothetical protein [Streptomyces pratensis]|uniref:hypothetical protein n=1 Tax=Streptomyces pratensis TaxID=1169025 RepID=UPI00301A5404